MKKVYLLLLAALTIILNIQSVHAQGSEPPIPPVPTSGNVVLDTLNWLTPAQETEINAINKKLDEAGLAQIAVVTLDDCGSDKQKFRNDLFRAWGIGHADDNDGLLILVCWYGGDQARRSVEQETGYGLEGTLPDVLTARVASDNFVPAFQANRPGDGLVAMVQRYDTLIRQPGQVAPTVASSSTNATDVYLIIGTSGLLGTFPGLILATVYHNLKKPDRPEKKKKGKFKKGSAEAKPIKVNGVVIPTLRQIAVAEAWALPAIIGFFMTDNWSTWLPIPWLQQIYLAIWAILIFWFIILLLILLVFSKDKGKSGRSGNDTWFSSGGSSSDSGSSFSGGDSGGGGSSTKF